MLYIARYQMVGSGCGGGGIYYYNEVKGAL